MSRQGERGRRVVPATWLSWLGLALCLGLAMTAWFFIWRANQRRSHDRFAAETMVLQDRIANRINAHEQILRAASQIIAQRPALPTRREWREFVSDLDLGRLNPGVQALGFAQWIPMQDLARHVRRLRAEGFPDYEVRPGGPLPPDGGVSSIIYTEPFDERNRRTFARDMLADATRREAMVRARDLGRVSLSGKVKLYQEGSTQVQAGTVLYVPVYRRGLPTGTVQERREALLGWAYLDFRMDNLLEGVLGPSSQGVYLELFDGRSQLGEDLLYARKGFKPAVGRPWVTRTDFSVAGRVWTLRCTPGTDFSPGKGVGFYFAIVSLGLVLSGAIFSLLRTLARSEQKAVSVAEERYENLQLILDSMSEAIYGIDTEGRCTFCNPACLRLTGYARADQVLGRNMHDLIHHSRPDRSRFPVEDCRIFQAFREGTGTHVDDEVLWRADGTSFMAEYWSFPQFRDGRIVGAVVTFMDITESRMASEALRESESRFRQLAEIFPETIFEATLDGRITYLNEQAYARLGLGSREDLQERNLLEFVHPEDRQMVLERIQLRAGATHGGFIEFRGLRADATPFCGMAFSAAILVKGAPVGIRGFILDISEHKKAEQTLRRGEERLSQIIEATRAGTWEWNVQTGEQVCNERWAGMLGYTLAELAPVTVETWTRLVHPDDLVPQRAMLESHFRGEIAHCDSEIRMRHRDGSWVWIQDRGQVTEWTEGKPLRMFGTHTEISERKRVEADLRVSNEQLKEATEQARVLAHQFEQASKAKSEFLANMSHEIRTPMNGVIGMTGLLLDTRLDREQRRYAEIVRNSGEALLALLNDILDFSKIEAGKLTMEVLDFDLRSLLDDLAATLALRAGQKGLEFVCAAAPEIPNDLCGDPGRLRQVLHNLVGNAIKFTHVGEVALRVGLVSRDDREVVIRFSIKDTGIGIPADKQQMLFQKFTQVDPSNTRQYGGTGLGLAISKELAELMGGEIGLESVEGQGSEFWFTARFARQSERERTLPPPADIRGAHVLVVDDNATNREVFMIQLQAWGVRAEQAPDGPGALQALGRAWTAGDPYQVAILDMQMPGMDGIVLAQAIKADPALRETRLVLMSSVSQKGDSKAVEKLGFAAFLPKPARQSDLFGCLSVVLGIEDAGQAQRPIITRHTLRDMNRGAVRILLAEDNLTNQQVALGILRNLGLRADAVADGLEALLALALQPYDLVLMDVQMPEMDGLEATRRIRGPRSPVKDHQVPIIALTAHAMQSDRERCLAAGMNDYVAKPIIPQALAEALERWLPRRALRREEVPARARELPPGPRVKPPPPVFDREGMMARLVHDEGLAHTVVTAFMADVPRRIQALKDHLDAGDAKGLERQAHTIKGASANLCCEALRAAAAELEGAGKAGSMDAARTLVPGLESQFAQLQAAMGQHFQIPGSG